MKQFLFWLLAITPLLQVLPAQNTPLQLFFEKHKETPGFTHAFLSKDLFDVASKQDIRAEDWQGLHHVVQHIGALEILVADSITNGNQLYKEAKSCIPVTDLDELLTVRDGQTNVRIWVKSVENEITDLVLLVGAPEDFVLICFAGVLQLGNLSELPSLFEAGKTATLAKQAENASAAFSIAPNPSTGQILIDLPNEQDLLERLDILDAQGRLVFSQQLEASSHQYINLSAVKPGTYWAQLKTLNGKIGVKQLQIVH